ncbi:MAG: glucokinase [Myxococcaceae bacterium]|nr:glucokinase [Myxococcaceae bacterium]
MVNQLALGVDLGGTNVRAAVVDRESGVVTATVKGVHTDKSPEAVVASIARATDEATKLAGVVGRLSCGVAVAGQLRGDVVSVAPNLGWREVPFGLLLAAKLGRPVAVVNDLKAAAWGEFRVGAAREETDTFTCFVGSGIGGATIASGRLVLGARGVAGEIGHVKVKFEGGRLCGCGEYGCIEAYAGGVNLAAWMAESGLEGGAAELEVQAHAGNVEALRLWDFASSSLALVVANQVTALNPGMVVLGGGVLMRCPKLYERIVKTIETRALAASRVGLKIAFAALGDDSGVVGAAMLGSELQSRG